MLNAVFIQGRLVKNVEMKEGNGKAFAVFCVACQRNFKNAKGEYDTDFVDCVAYGATGDFINKYFHKGDMILVSGELNLRIYEDKNGTKHKVAVINVNKAHFTGEKKNAANDEPYEVGGTPY